jgi:peptidoglycan/LPS O-acetylase OafA/YrhL
VEEKKSHNNWVRGVDSIRFVLAVMVFLSHAENEVAIFLKSFDNRIIYYAGVAFNHIFLGPGAVIAFFIISGFVIHYPFKEKQLNVKQFLVRRWVRIALPLLVVILISMPMHGFWMIPIWSLYCELIYYTLYPLLRRLPISWTMQFVISFIISVVLIFTLSGNELTSMLTQTDVNYTGSYAMLGDLLTWLVGLPCWLIGVIIAENVDKWKWNVSTIGIYLFRGIMLFLAAIVVGLKAHWFVSYLFTLNFFAPVIGIWITAEIIYFRDHQPLKWLEYGGKFSYSLYLLHVMLLSIIHIVLKESLYTYPLIILLTIFMAWIFYILVENPSHKLSRYLASRV